MANHPGNHSSNTNAAAWLGLLLQSINAQRAEAIIRMEYRSFINRPIMTPCQILYQSRRLVFRLLSVNRWTDLLIRPSLQQYPSRN